MEVGSVPSGWAIAELSGNASTYWVGRGTGGCQFSMDLVSDDIVFLQKVILCSVSPGFRYGRPHPLTLGVGIVFQAWEQTAGFSHHGTSTVSFHRS